MPQSSITYSDAAPIAEAASESPLFIIESKRSLHILGLKELWQYRELLYFLTWRDIKVRYKQATLGIAWAIIQPLTTMLIFWVFFGKFAKIPSDGIPYPLFSLAGMLPWTYFAGALHRGTQSIVGSSHLISKVYFPRLAIPLSAVLAGLIDYSISLVLFAAFLLYYGVTPSWGWFVTLPLLTFMTVCLALGMSLWLSALNVRYRDVSHIMPFVAQIWMYATPIVYPLSLVPESYQWMVRLNPMTGIIEGFRSQISGGIWDTQSVLFSAIFIAILLTTGVIYFSKTERAFADVV